MSENFGISDSLINLLLKDSNGQYNVLSGLGSKLFTIVLLGGALSKFFDESSPEFVAAVNKNASKDSVASNILTSGYSALKIEVDGMLTIGAKRNVEENPHQKYLQDQGAVRKAAGMNEQVFMVTEILNKFTNGTISANSLGNPKTIDDYAAAIKGAGHSRKNDFEFKSGDQFVANIEGKDRLVLVESFNSETKAAKLTFVTNQDAVTGLMKSAAKMMGKSEEELQAPKVNQSVELTVQQDKSGKAVLSNGTVTITPKSEILDIEGLVKAKAPELYKNKQQELGLTGNSLGVETSATKENNGNFLGSLNIDYIKLNLNIPTSGIKLPDIKLAENQGQTAPLSKLVALGENKDDKTPPPTRG